MKKKQTNTKKEQKTKVVHLVNKRGKIQEIICVQETSCGTWDMFGEDDKNEKR